MKTGTKSLLFGVHQFAWHPLTVARAWKATYGRWPGFWESVAILVHDWGYWGCRDMDINEGVFHPVAGARIILWLYLRTHRHLPCGERLMNAYALADLVRHHSRQMSKFDGVHPSRLCAPDKLSVLHDPEWFYLLRARLSGEIKEYVACTSLENVPTPKLWLAAYKQSVRKHFCK